MCLSGLCADSQQDTISIEPMRSFMLGIAVGAIVTIAIVQLGPSKSTPLALGESTPASVKTATPESICGRNTFNILVEVARFLIPPDKVQPTLEKQQQAVAEEVRTRLDRLAGEAQNRLDRAGLRHDLACPVILSVFGMLTEDSPGRWTVSTSVELRKTEHAAMDYPTWDSGVYKTWWHTRGEAQDDLERSLLERVQRFLIYFGKPKDGSSAVTWPIAPKP